MPATIFVSKDEKCFLLVEVNVVGPAGEQSTGWRRTQVIYVNRNDAIAEHRVDLGPAEDFEAPQFRIPGLWEHTVAELQDIAEQKRWADSYAKRFLEEKAAGSTLIPDFLQQLEWKQAVLNNRSAFGPHVVHQRNGFSKEGAHEWLRQNSTN